MTQEPITTECCILRAPHRPYTYLYLRSDLSLDDVPETLQTLFAGAEWVMDLDLAERESLAKEDIEMVRRHVANPGYYLQLPPEDDPSGWLDLPPKKP